jgi:hypothetical protein
MNPKCAPLDLLTSTRSTQQMRCLQKKTSTRERLVRQRLDARICTKRMRDAPAPARQATFTRVNKATLKSIALTIGRQAIDRAADA